MLFGNNSNNLEKPVYFPFSFLGWDSISEKVGNISEAFNKNTNQLIYLLNEKIVKLQHAFSPFRFQSFKPSNMSMTELFVIFSFVRLVNISFR